MLLAWSRTERDLMRRSVSNASIAWADDLLLPKVTFLLIFVKILLMFGHAGSSLQPGLSLAAASGGYPWSRCLRFSARRLLLFWSTGSRCSGFSSCSSWAGE